MRPDSCKKQSSCNHLRLAPSTGHNSGQLASSSSLSKRPLRCNCRSEGEEKGGKGEKAECARETRGEREWRERKRGLMMIITRK